MTGRPDSKPCANCGPPAIGADGRDGLCVTCYRCVKVGAVSLLQAFAKEVRT